MAWRKTHGNKAKSGETLTWENAHQDPAPKIPPGVGGEIPRAADGTIRSPEAARQLALLRHAVPDFVKREVVCSPEFSPFNTQRQEWTRHRVAELAAQTGAVSRGVGARVRAAGWGVAFGEYLASQAAQTGDMDTMDKALTILSKASVEDEKARRLAIDEAKARPQADPHRTLEAAFGPSAILPPMPTTPEGDDS